ncbi:type III restriction-modification system endonuclease [Aliarcobacter cryaerophilus]|uniref:type III restriction-modification system endonuclease n=1 Tax=Aliarcobacter cryaerophilus TaxID=28198 RepID=UPI000829552C|nr:DEAD/DEAH box helicase family protein [Aliarcobacter cryaerophilus]
MRIQFESSLEYQDKAIQSIVNIFEGQEICQSNFTVSAMNDNILTYQSELGIGNRLELLDDEILLNVQNIQLKNGLPQSQKLNSMDFSVEMETGTGKTYVYLKTVFELNKKYGFTKFIIVVPSIAIKEGTYKTLEITKEHFQSQFDNVNYDYFVYDSSNLEQVRDFATSNEIRIMVINIDAFRKSFSDTSKDSKANIIHRQNDRLNGQKPIEFIRSTNPIVIIDEPQSVDNTPKSKEAIETLNPLCKLRYSATHVEKFNLMYKLDSIDAYEQKLVKQIEVANVKTSENSNSAYMNFTSVEKVKTPITARIEIYQNATKGVKKSSITIKDNSDLYELSNGLDIYSGYIVNEINRTPNDEYIEFTNGVSINLGQTVGEIDDDTIKRLQIRKTIQEHLEKEMKLNSQGIKVLSLFFIDRVSNYREYNSDGTVLKGKYAKWFEEEYKEVIKQRRFRTLFEGIKDIDTEVEKIHNGYFSRDKKGVLKDSTGNNKEDEDTFTLIMKDKEKLLSFKSQLRFIFSHSALKEGWDNPNVFQICTLNETNSVIKKRQEIGRGLRICVNQNGERVYGYPINTLTVMANESYEDFAKGLQEEIEKEEGIKFGVITPYEFANIAVRNELGDLEYFGADKSENIYNFLLDNEYIDKKGKIQDKLKKEIKENSFKVPEEYEIAQDEIIQRITKIGGSLNIKNADDKKEVKLNKQVMLSDDFKELWERIKYKTTYKVDFDEDKLVDECAQQIALNGTVGKIKYLYSKATNKITKVGVEIDESTIKNEFSDCDIIDYKLPDIVTYLQNETNLTRRNIVNILIKSEKLESFKNNPQKFIDICVSIIKKTMNLFIVDGITYQKLGNEYYYSQELFEENELYGYLSKNMYLNKENKSPYDYTVYDSDIEASFARSFNENDNVKLFTKLPSWFKIDTPLGTYNPDWAVLIEIDNSEKLYFVVESKGADLGLDLRTAENAKIKCGKKHFEAIKSDIKLIQSSSYKNFIEKI